jgi:hypothetical protein
MRIAPIKRTTETDDEFEDRKDVHNSRIHKARAYLMLNCEQHIVEKCIPFDTAQAVWDHLALYKPTGQAYEFSVYLEWENLRYDGKDLETFVDNYRGKLQQLKSTTLKISDSQALYRLLILVEPFFQQFAATIRHQLRQEQAVTITDCIASLLDEYTAQMNASNSTAMIARGGTGLGSQQQQPTQQQRQRLTGARWHCTYCDKDGHSETRCYDKHPELKAANKKKNRDSADRKRKPEGESHTSFHTEASKPTVPPAAPHDFGPSRSFMASTVPGPSPSY